MKLLKVSANVDKEGRLVMPMESVKLEGFRPGDEVSALLAVPEDQKFPGLMMLAAPKDSAPSTGIWTSPASPAPLSSGNRTYSTACRTVSGRYSGPSASIPTPCGRL